MDCSPPPALISLPPVVPSTSTAANSSVYSRKFGAESGRLFEKGASYFYSKRGSLNRRTKSFDEYSTQLCSDWDQEGLRSINIDQRTRRYCQHRSSIIMPGTMPNIQERSMSLTSEKDLAEDAEWKRIQQNTFTRWVNEQLKVVERSINNLETDLSDGLQLIKLIEVLSHRHLPKHNTRPNFRSQKLENVSVALKFLEDDEGIRIVNIDSSDIVDQRLKLILGLIWTLILNYHISLAVWESDKDGAEGGAVELGNGAQAAGDGLSAEGGSPPSRKISRGKPDETPKQRLMGWVKAKLPPIANVNNFSSDWNDGLALGALVDSVAPGLNPDWEDWDRREPLKNTSTAMDLAEKWLNVAKLVEPQEMIDPNVDEQSIMTYLSQYPNAKLAPGAPLTEKAPKSPRRKPLILMEPEMQKKDVPYTEAPRVMSGQVPMDQGGPFARAYGPGLQRERLVTAKGQTYFLIEPLGGKVADLHVTIQDPQANLVPHDEKLSKTSGSHTVTYTPTRDGIHMISVMYGGVAAEGSPFEVDVGPPPAEPGKVRASGPGLSDDCVVGRPTYFDVFSEGAGGDGNVEVVIVDPKGDREIVQPKVSLVKDSQHRCEFEPCVPGLHSVNVFYSKRPIAGSPFGVRVKPTSYPHLVRAWGRGLQSHGVRVGDRPEFFVALAGAGEGSMDVKVLGPDGKPCNVDLLRQEGGELNHYYYSPKKAGVHSVLVEFNAEHVADSPYEVDVGEKTSLRTRAFGPGLEGGVCNIPCDFTVEPNGDPGPLGFSIEGPSEAQISSQDNGDGTADVNWVPTNPGIYAVHVMSKGDDIRDSPFMVDVQPYRDGFRPSAVVCQGPGLQRKDGVKKGVPTNFTILTKEAGLGDTMPKVWGVDKDYEPINISMRDDGDGFHTCAYTPRKASRHTIMVSHGGVAVPGSPFRVQVAELTDPTQVRVYGPGVEGHIKSTQPTHFIVDCKQAGPGEIDVALTDDKGGAVDIDVLDNNDGSFTVKYTAPRPGAYQLRVEFAGVEIPGSPLQINVNPHLDVSQVRVEGLERTTVTVNTKTQFHVLNAHLDDSSEIKVQITAPSGHLVEAIIEQTASGFRVRFIPSEIGDYTIGVYLDEVELNQSPFVITSADLPLMPLPNGKTQVSSAGSSSGRSDKSQKRRYSAITGERQTQSDTDEPPQATATEERRLGSGMHESEYVPSVSETGRTTPDVRKVTVEGQAIFIDSTTEFIVNARSIPPQYGSSSVGPRVPPSEPVRCLLYEPTKDIPLKLHVRDNKDGTYRVQFVPTVEGVHHVRVEYEGIEIPTSQIALFAERGYDAMRCKATGAGLEGGTVGEPATFHVETKNAGVGDLKVAIEGPTKADITNKDIGDNTLQVDYIPKDPGEYNISIKFAETEIPGSPFRAVIEHPFDVGQVSVVGDGLMPENVREGKPLKFVVDAAKTAAAPLDVEVQAWTADGDPIEPAPTASVEEISKSRCYAVSVDPPQAGTNLLLDVKHGGQPVSGSPFRRVVLPAFEPKKVQMQLEHTDDVLASFPVDVLFDTKNAGQALLECHIKLPSGESFAAEVETLGETNDDHRVRWTPEDVGVYELELLYGGEPCISAPKRINVLPTGDADKCFIMEKPDETVPVNREVAITVNRAAAGKGKVTATVSPNYDGAPKLPVAFEEHDDGTTNVYFLPNQPEPYRVQLKFGGQPIPKGDFVIYAQDADHFDSTHRPTEDTFEKIYPVEIHRLDIDPKQINIADLKASVIMPSKKADVPVVSENHDGTVSVKYQPKMEGQHEMHVKYEGVHVAGSPFTFYVDSIKDGYTTAFGPGLVYGVAGEPAAFTVCVKEAAGGGLNVRVTGPAKPDIKCHDNKDGSCSVSWVPPAGGEYQIHISYAGKEIRGSPFTAKIAGEGRKRAHLSLGSPSEVKLDIKDELKGLSASIKSPSGIEEPCFIRKIDDNHVGVQFTPREAGDSLVTVKKNGQLLPKAPFKIKVSKEEVGDANKVKISGPGLTQAETGKDAKFVVDTRNAGFGGLSVTLEGPSKGEIKCLDSKEQTINLAYKTAEPGVYVLGVKFADHHVPGSPFTVNCIGQGTGTVAEKLSKQRPQQKLVYPGDPCEMYLKLPNTSPMGMHAKLMDPSGHAEDIEIQELADAQYLIRFKAVKEGPHAVSVLHKDQHVGGSPFPFTVGPYSEGGAHKVKAGGEGLHKGEINIPNYFNVYTREAGAGNLTVAVEGPSKAKLDLQESKDGSCAVQWTVAKTGTYTVAVKWDDEHIPDSPFKLFISPSTGEARKLEICSFPDMGLQLNKPVTFTVLTHGAKGHLDAKTNSPSGLEDDCYVTPIEDGESYAVRFIPKEQGNHYVSILLDGTHMRDSPFRIRVGGKDESDPTAITVSGQGVKKAETGHKCEFIINTCNAGAGNLQVTCDGPSKVTLDAYEVDVGYKVRYTPMAPGNYFFVIKYNSIHVPGSPFKVPCEGKELGGGGFNESSTVKIVAVAKTGKATRDAPKFTSDAGKVDCKGMGLKKAYAGKLNHFNVDCSKAGEDILWVGVHGMKGTADEVLVKHQGRGQYIVNYKISERGPLFIFVKYGEEHIPGSPFSLEI